MTEKEGVVYVRAEREAGVRPDPAGYVIVSVDHSRGVIRADHYTTDDDLRAVVEGEDPRAIYWEFIEREWITEMGHAAYLGKELARAERALETGESYEQGPC